MENSTMNSTSPETGTRNEGEGSQSGARAYNSGVQEFIRTNDVKKAAEQAAQELDGPEGSSLRAAEECGKLAAQGEDPALRDVSRRHDELTDLSPAQRRATLEQVLRLVGQGCSQARAVRI